MIPNTCVGFLGSFWQSFPYDRLFLHAPIRLMFRSILFRVHGFGCLSSNNAIIKKVLSLNSTVSQLPVTDLKCALLDLQKRKQQDVHECSKALDVWEDVRFPATPGQD